MNKKQFLSKLNVSRLEDKPIRKQAEQIAMGYAWQERMALSPKKSEVNYFFNVLQHV